jgi:hypothetical protein
LRPWTRAGSLLYTSSTSPQGHLARFFSPYWTRTSVHRQTSSSTFYYYLTYSRLILIAFFLPICSGFHRYVALPILSEQLAQFHRKMFVGGLNWDTTDGTWYLFRLRLLLLIASLETLRQYFSEFGKVDACTIMRDASGRSRGFAFLTFEDPAAVNAVMVREHYLDGKIVS